MTNKIESQTPVSEVSGVGKKFKSKLKKLGIETVEDLLWHLPSRYEDYSETKNIEELSKSDTVTVHGKITDVNMRRSWKKKFSIFEATVSDETGSIKAVWFNQPYLKNTLEPGTDVNIAGEVKTHKGELQFSNPIYEKTEYGDEPIHTARIIPIYSETKGLTSRGLRYLIKPQLNNVDIQEPIPKEVLSKEELLDIKSSLNKIHFPNNQKEIESAKTRFAFEDLFFLQLHNFKQKQKNQNQPFHKIDPDIDFIKKKVSNLPFELTDSQRKTLWETLKDMGGDSPMNRLLQGDVGSGKTVVALLAAINTANKGFQSAFMAPTELLAKQHYQTFLKLFPDFPEGIALLTSNESEIYFGEGLKEDLSKKNLIKKIKEGRVKIIIGTHALIQKKVGFEKLGFVIVDEQHRFGVKQRAALTNEKEVPHFLSMSATPIPRTLSLTVFGDLDMSTIMELPANRKPITTKLIPPSERKSAYSFIKKEVEKGRQVFVVCPRIEREGGQKNKKDSVWSDVKAVKEEYKKLSEKVFPKLKIGMLHGKIQPEKKNRTMQKFADGDIDILVSTSVVEVGIDVPNASIMMVEDADRFGLAQLYQFQGRVGRGEHKSYCFLFTKSKSKQTLKRLRSVVEAKNGLDLAKKDLKLRGPGEFLGKSQSGMPDLAMKAIQNPKLVTKTRNAAKNFIFNNKNFKDFPNLKRRLEKFESKIHEE